MKKNDFIYLMGFISIFLGLISSAGYGIGRGIMENSYLTAAVITLPAVMLIAALGRLIWVGSHHLLSQEGVAARSRDQHRRKSMKATATKVA